MKINGILLTVFSVFWIAVLWIEYLHKHPLYTRAFQEFGYYGLWAVKLFAFAGVGFILSTNQKIKKYAKGYLLVIWTFIWLVLQLAVYKTQYLDKASIEISPLLASLKIYGYALLSVLIFISTFAAGRLISNPLRFKSTALNVLLDLAIGLVFFSFVVFLLGIFKVLYFWSVGIVLLAFIGLQYKAVLALLKDLLNIDLDPKLDRTTSVLYYIILFIVLDIVVFNMAQASTPVPRGFDSLTFYANLPKLIGDGHALVSGFPPHNWSLVMSSGWVLFDSPEVSTLLSFAGGVLALAVSYIIGKRYLGLNPLMAITVSALWYTLPAFVTQSSNELKIDLALLFLELITLVAVVRHRQVSKSGLKWMTHIVIGLLMGYLLGVKLTAIYFILALVAIYWWDKEKPRLFIGISALMIGSVLMLGLDKVSGLSIYHAYSLPVGLFIALGGLILIGLNLKDHSDFVLRIIKSNVMIGCVAFVSFTPWMIKNAMDADTLSPRTILFGEQGGLKLDMKTLDDNYLNSRSNPG